MLPSSLINSPVDNKKYGGSVILKEDAYKGGYFSLVPNFNYALYVKKDGYFSVYRDFNSNLFREDTLLRINMNKIDHTIGNNIDGGESGGVFTSS